MVSETIADGKRGLSVQILTNPELAASLRCIEIEGNPWFVAKDACDTLGLENVTKALLRLDEDEKGLNSIQTLGGVQKLNFVSESGLYALILRSDKPAAKLFRKWVTSEVLPSIRRTGGYRASLAGLESRRESAVSRLRAAQDELKQIHATVDALKLEAAREIAEELGLEVRFQLPGAGGLLQPTADRVKRHRRCQKLDFAAIAAAMPCPLTYGHAVAWLEAQDGITAANARVRIHRMETLRLIGRNFQGQLVHLPTN